MTLFLAKRLAILVATLLVTSLVVFVVLEILPGDPAQVMLGTDGARASYWRSYGGKPGLDYLLKEFSDRAKKLGVTDAELRQVFVENPSWAYAFRR